MADNYEMAMDHLKDAADRIAEEADEVAALSAELDEMRRRVEQLKARGRIVAKLARQRRREFEAVWNGELDCAHCGRLTNNGICTECRHGVSPLKKSEKRAEKAEAERDEARRERDAAQNQAAMHERNHDIEVRLHRDTQNVLMDTAHGWGLAERDLAALRRRVEEKDAALRQVVPFAGALADHVAHCEDGSLNGWDGLDLVTKAREAFDAGSAALASPPVAAQGAKTCDPSYRSQSLKWWCNTHHQWMKCEWPNQQPEPCTVKQ